MRTLIALLLSTLPLLASPNTMQGVQFCPLRLNAKENLENWLTYSEQFDQSVWNPYLGTVIANSATAPDGTMTADTVAGGRIREYISTDWYGETFEFSAWLKATNNVPKTVYVGLSKEGYADYTPNVVTITDTWQKYSVSVTGANHGTTVIADLDNASLTEAFYVWGAQLRRTTKSATYVKTTATPFVNDVVGPSVVAHYDPNSPLNTLNGAGMSQLKNLAPDALENWLLWSEDFTKADWVEYNGTTKVGVASGVGPNGEDAMEVNFGATGGPTAGAIYQIVYPSQASTQYWLVRAKTGTTTVRLGWWDGSDPAVFLTADLPLTTSWVVLSQDISATLGASSNLSIRNNVAGDSGNVYVLRAQLRRATKSPSYVKTEGIRYVVEDRDLNQSTGASQPLLADMANGTKCLLFDGTDDYMKTATFPLVQPETVVGVFEQIVWTQDDTLFDGFGGSTLRVAQEGATPGLQAYNGAWSLPNSGLALGQFGLVVSTANGASSSLKAGATEITGDYGSVAANGFTLGAWGGISAQANIRTADLLILNRVLTSAEQSYLVQGLGRKAGVNVW